MSEFPEMPDGERMLRIKEVAVFMSEEDVARADLSSPVKIGDVKI